MSLTADRGSLLAAPELRSGLVRFVRGRVPEPDVDDVVQATLADAFAAREAPQEAEELRRWVFGIAKNKIVDVHRRGGREMPRERIAEETAAESAPLSARDLLRWAEEELPEAEDAKSTLDWMLREGDGEKLEHIAEEAQLPATRVRQRVSRMRKYFRSRWAAQLAAAAALALIGVVIWAWLKSRTTPAPQEIAREVPQDERAREIRRIALERCQARDFTPCIQELDRAKAIDPVGDEAAAIQEARAAAARGLAPVPPPERPPPSPPAPSASSPTRPTPVPMDVKKMAPEKGSSLQPDSKNVQSEPIQQMKAAPKKAASKAEDFSSK